MLDLKNVSLRGRNFFMRMRDLYNNGLKILSVNETENVDTLFTMLQQ